MTKTPQTPLVSQYRPKEFSDMINLGDWKRYEEFVKTPMEMPNLMFWGPPGVGKTSLAMIILKKLQPIDVLRINGSDTTGVDTIRTKVYNFVTAKTSVNNKPKIVWIEEFDGMSDEAHAALRSMMEQFEKNARYIVTLNYIAKIPDAIISRFSAVEFRKPTDAEMFPRLRNMCDAEGIVIKNDILREIITQNRGDIRSAINNIQLLSANNLKSITIRDIQNTKRLATQIVDFIKDKNWSYLRKEVPKVNPDYNILLIEIDEVFFNMDIPMSKKADLNEIISDGQVDMSLSFNKDIAFGAIASRLIKAFSN